MRRTCSHAAYAVGVSQAGFVGEAAVSCAPLQDESGRPAGFVGTIQDISDYKRTYEALRRSEAYLAEAQRLTQTGSFALNAATGEPTHFSAEHYRLFGFDPDLGVPSLVEHLERLTCVLQRHVGRSRDHDRSGQRDRLHQRDHHIARTRR